MHQREDHHQEIQHFGDLPEASLDDNSHSLLYIYIYIYKR